jgi:autotransporter-associated beta strand protein
MAAALAAGVGLTLGSHAQAATDTWVGNDGATANWSDGVDWLSGSAPSSADALVFGLAGSSGTSLNDDLGAGFSISSINFLTGASAFTLGTNNASSINIGSSITNNSISSETISNINLATTGNLTVDTAAGNVTIGSVISGSFGLIKTGAGTLFLSAANTYTGATSVGDISVGGGNTGSAMTKYGGGVLDLNFAAPGAPTSNILYNGVTAGQMNFGGGTLEIDGAAGTANTQSLGALNLAAGFSTIDLNPGAGGTVSLSTGAWTTPAASLSNNNALAGQMNIILPAGATMTTSQGNASSASLVNGVLSFGGQLANVTVNESSWAVRSGGQVAALPTSSYFATTAGSVGTGTQAADVVTNTTLFLVNAKANSLRFNTAANDTVAIDLATLVLPGGGILMTPNVGAHTETISALIGSIAGGPNTGLTIFQYDTLGTLAISSPIVNNASGSFDDLTIGGGGVVVLSGANTYTGPTNINGGTVISNSNSNFGSTTGTVAGININNATLEFTGSSTITLGTTATTGLRAIGIGSMGATIDVTGSIVVNVPGVITSQNIAGAGNLTKTDTGILNLSGANTYTGTTTAAGGILELSNANALPGGVGASGGTSLLNFNGGVVGLTTTVPTFSRSIGTGSSQVEWTGSGGFAAMNSDSTVNLGGALAVAKWNSGGFVPSGSALILGATAATKTVTFANPIDFNGGVQTINVVRGTGPRDAILSGALSDSTGTTGGFTKLGTGILALSGTSTYTGPTNINAGILQLINGGSLGNTTVNINTGATLTTVGNTSHVSGTVSVNTGGILDLRDSAANDTLNIGTLSLAGGGVMDFDLNSTHNTDSLLITNFAGTGLTTLNFATIGAMTAGNSYVLVNGGTGISTSDFVLNPNQIPGFYLSLSATGGNNLTLNVAGAQTAPTVAYWKGTVDNVWSDASGVTNWVDVNGNPVTTPQATTQVVFSAPTPANQALTVPGSVSAVDSITINDPTALTIGGTSALTLGAAATGNGIVVGATAAADVISTSTLALGKSQTWQNNSPNLLTVSSIITGTSSMALTINSSGSGAIRFSGTNTYAGGTTITNGTLQVGNTQALGTGAVTINGGALDLDGLNLTLRGLIGSGGQVTDSATTASTLTDSVAASTTVTYAGSINNGSGTVAFSVTGTGTQILTGSSNTYTGGTTISSTGTLQIGDGVSNIGSLPGNVADGKTLIFKTPTSSTLVYSGNISGNGTLSVSGAGLDVLSGDNTEVGGVNVSAGTVQMGSNTGVDKVPVVLGTGATFDLNSHNITVSSLSSASTAVTALVTNSVPASLSTLTVTATGSYFGTIADGAGQTALSLTAGTLTLNNAGNSYTGPTSITGGVLSLKSGGSLGNTAVTITGGALAASGATSQITGSVAVNSGGAIDLRNGAVGDLLTINSLSLGGGGALDFDLGAASGAGDALAITNLFSNTGTTALNFANVGTLVAGNTYTLISNAAGIAASDFTYNPNTFPNLSLNVSTVGNNLVLTVQGPPPPAPFAYWMGGVDNVWSDTTGNTTNWVDANGNGVAVPTSGTQVIFSATGATRQASTNIGAITSVDSITINDPTNLTITGTGTVTLAGTATGNGILVNSTAGTDVISTRGVALGSPQTWQNNSPNNFTVSSVISGVAANTLTINSSGTGVFFFTGANTYSGGTVINNGTLEIGSATALGAGNLTVNGGELDLNGQTATIHGIRGAGGTVTNSNATTALITDSIAANTTMNYSGAITNGNGLVALTLAGNGTQEFTGSGNTYTGGTTIPTTAVLIIGDGTANPGSLSGNVVDNHFLEFNTPASTTVTYTGNVSSSSGVSGSIITIGPGTALLTGDITALGGATITNGTLQMGSNTALDNVPLTIGANGALDLNAHSVAVSTLNTATTAVTALITNSNSTSLGTLSVNAGGNYYGKITDGLGQTGLTLAGGTLALFNSGNSYTGATNINGGVLALKSGGSLGNTAVAVNNTGMLTASGATSAITGSVTVNPGGALDLRNGVATDTLTIGTLSLAGSGSLGFDLGNATGVNDELAISNFSNAGVTAINFTETGSLTVGGTFTYTLINGGAGIDPSDFSFNPSQFTGFNASLSAPGGTSLILVIAAAPPPPPFAYWQGSIDGNWSSGSGTNTNWVDGNGVGVGQPGGSTQVIFSANSPQNEANTTLGSITSIDSITLNTATSLTINGAGTVTLNAAATSNGIVVGPNGGTDTIAVAGIFLGAAQTWSNNSNNLLTVSSVISGGATSALTINNSGTAPILLTGSNTFTGGVIIANGTLQVGSPTALGAGALAVNGGTLDLNGQAISLNGINGSGGLITDSTGTFAGITDTVTSSTLATSTMTFAGSITDGNGKVSIDVTGGGVQILSGTGNNWSGGTTIALTTTLQIGDGVSSPGSLAGDTTDNGLLAFATPASTTIFYGGNASGLLGTLSETGGGTVVLSGNNTIGTVNATNGTIKMGSTTGINNSAVTIGATGVVDLAGFNTTAFSLNAAATATTAVVTNSTGTLATLSVGSGGTYNGIITGGASTSLKVTGGTLILANMNSSYSAGTTVTGGTLQAGNGVTPTTGFSPFSDNAMGTGPVVVSNATLNLNPMAATTTVNVLSTPLIFNYSNAITLGGGATIRSSSGVNVINAALIINGTGNAMTVQYPTMPLEFNGGISGSGNVTVSGVSNIFPPKNVEFFGDGTGYTGTITLTASAAQILVGGSTALLNANISINGNNAANNDTADVLFPYSVGSALVFPSPGGTFNTTVGSINSATTGSGNINLVTLDGVFPVNLGIGNNNQNSTLSGIINDTPTYSGAMSVSGSITKVGTGSLVLAGANTYTGNTTINAGTLVAAYHTSSATASSTGLGNVQLVGGALASSAGATSYVAGNVVAGNASSNTVAPGGVGTIGSLVIGGLTTTTMTTLNFDLGTGSGEITNGDLLTLGNGTVNIATGTLLSFGGTPISGDDYRLIGDLSSGAAVGAIPLGDFTLPTIGTLSLALSNSVDPGFIDLVVSGGGPANLVWDNGSGDGLWDTASTNFNGGSGDIAYSNGSLVTFNDNNGAGNYGVTLNTTVSPASVSVNNSNGNYTIGGIGSIAGTGSLTKAGSGKLTLNTVNTYTGGTNVTAGTLVVGVHGALPVGALSITNGNLQLAPSTGLATITSLSISGTGTFDISNNHVIVTYGAGPDPVASIAAMIATGYANGAWTGQGGILSSTAAANPGYGIGYADSADPGNPAGLASGTVEFAYTLLGDADLNQTVNGIDFGILAANFNKSVTSWDQGDFDYNGIVNGIDFTALAANFNKAAAGASAAVSPGDLAALEQFAAANGLVVDGSTIGQGITGTSVPEPVSTGLVALGAVGVLSRRQRRSRR